VVTKYLPQPDTDAIVGDVKNLFQHWVGDGFADLERMPSDTIAEIPKGTVRRYTPTAPTDPNALPTLIVPPMGGTAVSFDLRRGCSLVEFLLEQGRPLYLVDYGDISSLEDSDLGLEYWIDEVVPHAIQKVSEDAGGKPVQLVGWCLGGILGLFTDAAHPELPIASVATVASPFDFKQVALLEPVRILEDTTKGVVTTGLVRVLGGVPGKANSLIFKWLSPDKQLKKPLTIVKHRGNPETLAQIQAVDAMMDAIEAYPGRSIAQIYHTFIRTNHLSSGRMTLRGGRTLDLVNVDVPVMNIAGVGDLFFAPPLSAHRVGDLLPNSPHVRLETAPGGHLGVLTGTRARDTTWQYLIEFLRSVDQGQEVVQDDDEVRVAYVDTE
jgi:polyhydroxyalkanoate synthase subunit PhaC